MPTLLPPPQQPLVAEFTLTDRSNVLIHYLGDVFDWHGYVKFVSLAALRETSRDVPLDRLFVEPSVAAQYLSPDAMEASAPPATERISAALLEHRRVVLLGDPGSGKSTIVNWLCTAFSRASHDPLSRQPGGPFVPVPLVLRELGLGRAFATPSDPRLLWDRLIELFLARPVAAQLRADCAKHPRFQTSLLGRILRTGQAFLLLDGIDEIGSIEARAALRDAVHEGIRRYPRCRWLMTSRVVGYDEVPFDPLGPELPNRGRLAEPYRKALDLRPRGDGGISTAKAVVEAVAAAEGQRLTRPTVAARLYVAPFDDEQIDHFTRLWWAHHESNPHLAGTRPAEFLSALRQSRGARSLARLPHLLTMIALIYRVRAELPDGRALLYGLIADAYLGTLDKERGLEYLRPIPHGVDEMSRWLAAIAWRLQRERTEKPDSEWGVFITRCKLLELLSEIILPKPGDTSRHIAELFIDYVGRRSALLLPRGQTPSGDDLYAFLHLSFQEYFAAQFLRDRVADPDWRELDQENERYGTRPEDLRRYATLPVWRETLIFLWESAALVSRVFPQRLIERLLDWPRDVCLWGDFPAPTVQQLQAERGSGERLPIAQKVALIAGLSVNPHVVLEPLARVALWDRCWRWELQKQENFSTALPPYPRPDNTVARELLSRQSFGAEMTEALSRVASAGHAQWLILRGCVTLTDLAPLSNLGELRRLDISGCTGITDLAPLASLTGLDNLDISGCTGLSDLTPLANLTGLSDLEMGDWAQCPNLAPLASLVKLKFLSLGMCQGLTDLAPLSNLTGLIFLNISFCAELANLSPLAGFSSLRFLMLSGCTALTELAPLAHLRGLEDLYLDGCSDLGDLAPLFDLKGLQLLDLEGCTSLTDLSPLAKLRELRSLNLTGCKNISDLAPLFNLTKLEILKLEGCPRLGEGKVEQLRRALPQAAIKT